MQKKRKTKEHLLTILCRNGSLSLRFKNQQDYLSQYNLVLAAFRDLDKDMLLLLEDDKALFSLYLSEIVVIIIDK